MIKIREYNSPRFIMRSKTLANGIKVNFNGIDLVDAIRNGYDPSKNIPNVGINKDFGVSRGTLITSEQVSELKEKLEQIENELKKLNIDTSTQEGQLNAIAYFYKIMQRDIKYFNPLIRLGNWRSFQTDFTAIGVESPDTPYGALIKNYALCEGISKSFELLCNYFNMDCDTIHVENCGVGHAINRLRLENGDVTYVDVSAEIGMSEDGLYRTRDFKRVTPKEKVDTTTEYFLVNSGFLEKKGYRSEEFQKYRSTFMISQGKEELMENLQRKMSFRPIHKKGDISENELDI